MGRAARRSGFGAGLAVLAGAGLVSGPVGAAWGVVGGVVLGVIFPPSILASAATLGAAGAAAGKIRQLHHRIELGQELEGAIEPGHSGILALVSDPGAVEIRNALAAADHIVESAVSDAAARDMKAAAKEAQETESAPAAEPTVTFQASSQHVSPPVPAISRVAPSARNRPSGNPRFSIP